MALKDKVKKIRRWANIWLSQFRVMGLKNQRPSQSATKGVIVFKMDAIGDFLIWLDSASQYRRIYPNQQITLVCNTVCEEIAEHTGFFDEIIAIQSRKFESDNRYKKEILHMLSERCFQILLQPAYSRTLDMDLLAYCTPAERKIAFAADESRENLSRYITFRWIRRRLDAAYDQLICPGEENLMELERNAVFIRGLGHDFKAGYPVLPETKVREEILPAKPYVVIFPGASSGKKMWPIERFAQVGAYLISQQDMDVYLCGSSSEAYLYGKFVDCIEQEQWRARVHDYFGKTTLTELAEVIRGAKLLVGNDTSGIHFAAAVDTTGICIFGEFAYGRFLPYQCEKDCSGHHPVLVCHAGMACAGCSKGSITAECKEYLLKTGRHLCIDAVSVEQVIGQIKDVCGTER